ncbi:winged helix-turn-helix domain-containing protein [Pseudomonas sp. NPDC089407]|uniref:winged helix-turn-helix domain-containing protein n=1 Tax=Pseudomonas sp. NPDC089407 TaxID=3364464 RepID=UPI00384AFFB8
MHYKILAFSIDIGGLVVNGIRRVFERSALAGTDEALRLDSSRFEIYCNGVSHTLKPTPYRLMQLLVQNSGQIVSRKAIYREIWGYEFDPGTKLIEVQVHYLRGVLCRLRSVFEIKTYRGKGICLQALDQQPCSTQAPVPAKGPSERL